MATHKSAEKRSRQNETRRVRNSNVKSAVKTKIKSVVTAVDAKDKEKSKAALAATIPAIAKGSAKGALHKKTASRKISRLTKSVNALQK